MITAQVSLYPLQQASIGPPIREAVRVMRCGVMLGVLNRWSLLGLQRWQGSFDRRSITPRASMAWAS
jgi:hypothetical protein